MPRNPRIQPPGRGRIALLVGAFTLGALAWGSPQRATRNLASARELQQQGRFAESLPALRSALQRDPAEPEAQYRYGLALLRGGEPSRATWPLQAAVSSPEYGARAGPLLATAHLRTHNYHEALRVSDALLRTEPEHVEVRTLRARAQLSARRPEAALLDTRWLRARAPGDFEVSMLHAAALVGAGALEEARATYEEIKTLGLAGGDTDRQALACLATAGFTEEYLLDAERAEQLYDDCAARLPRNHVALQLLVSFFQRSGQAERSTMLLRAAASAAPRNLGVQWLLAQNLSESGDVEGAETALREAATRNASPEAWRLLAQQQRSAGSLRPALASLDAALALAGDPDPLLRFTRADLLIDLGEFEGAAASVAGLQPRVFEQLILGRCALLGGEAERALQHFESGLADWPDHVQVRRLAGQAALQLGDRERAISHLREALRGDPREPTTGLHLARLLAETGRHSEALRIAQSVRRLTQADLHGQAGLVAATALTGLGRADDARGVLEALADAEKGDQRALALAGLARLEARSGETERALNLLDRARASEPAGGQYAYEAAQIALHAGRPGLAEERLRAVVAHHPELLEARNDLAWLLAERGADLDLALSLARDAWAGLEDPNSLDTLGWVHLKRGELQPARRALEAALSLRPDATATRRRLTLAMRATGEESQQAPSPPESDPR